MHIPHPHADIKWAAAGFGIANSAAAYISWAANAWDASAWVAGITMICGALLGGIKMLSPVIADAIRTIGPALTELRRQREEFEKGSLSHQNEQLNEKLNMMSDRMEAANQYNKELTEQIILLSNRVEDANHKLHEVRNRANADALIRQDEAQVLKRDLESARAEIANLRHESLAKTQALEQRTEQMGLKVRENTADIRQAADNIAIMTRDSATFPTVSPGAIPPSTDVTPPIRQGPVIIPPDRAEKNSKPPA